MADTATLAAPHAARLQRPGWRDARLVVGVLVVLVSVGLGAKVIASADDTTPRYAAARTLVAGQPVSQDDVRRVDVRINGDAAKYLGAGRDIAPGTFALREVRAGELLPASALGSLDEVTVRPVTVPAASTSVIQLTDGSVVDVWVNAKVDSVGTDTYGKPTLLLTSASVAALPESADSRFGGTGTTGVQVLVPGDRVQELIAAIDQGAKVTLVPVPGSPWKDSS